MANEMIDLNLLPLETLAEMANEAAEQFEENAKKTVQKALDAGRYLIAAKEQLTHGEWGKWLGSNWNYTARTASGYMLLASKSETISDLLTAKNYNAAMRMIAAEKAEAEHEPSIVPRSERKPAKVVVSIPADEPDDSDSEIESPSDRQTRVLDDPGEPDADQVDDDPTPDPPTIKKTPPGTKKTPEDKKPRTQTVPVEIVDDEPEPAADPVDEWFQRHTLEDIVTRLIQKTENGYDQKKTAKALRKWADKLDPPTKFVKPDLDEVSEYFRELKAVDPDSFFDFYESKGWLVGKVSMKDWRASARRWVRENANGGNGNGHAAARNTGRRGLTADQVFG